MKLKNYFAAAVLAAAVSTNTHAATITVQTDQPGAKLNPAMWGIFFEDINFGADGGLYAEMVKNRGFEFPDPMMGWIEIHPNLAHGELSVRNDDPFNAANPHYLRIVSEGTAPFGVSNEGFRGMGVSKNETYDFSAQIRGVDGSPVLRLQLYGGDGTLLDSVGLTNFSSGWKKYTATLHPKDTDPKARLAIVMEGKGIVDLDMVSLFPRHTWKNRPGGLRADMVQALADMQPGFLRFPGGCIVEGSRVELAVTSGKKPSARWKNARCSSTAGTPNLSTAPRRIIINRSASASTNISSCARTSARSRCRF